MFEALNQAVQNAANHVRQAAIAGESRIQGVLMSLFHDMHAVIVALEARVAALEATQPQVPQPEGNAAQPPADAAQTPAPAADAPATTVTA